MKLDRAIELARAFSSSAEPSGILLTLRLILWRLRLLRLLTEAASLVVSSSPTSTVLYGKLDLTNSFRFKPSSTSDVPSSDRGRCRCGGGSLLLLLLASRRIHGELQQKNMATKITRMIKKKKGAVIPCDVESC
jgi:hypothetical protein